MSYPCGYGVCPVADPDWYEIDGTDVAVSLAIRKNRSRMGRRFMRVMSYGEYSALFAGETLTNTRVHSEWAHSESVGFCFFEVGDDYEEKYYEFIRVLNCPSGQDYAVVFVNDGTNLRRSSGLYENAWGDELEERVEYCTTQYDIENMKPIAAYDFAIGWLE